MYSETDEGLCFMELATHIIQRQGTVMNHDESNLLPRYRDGDPDAFAELLQAYRAPVYGYLVRCGVAEDARDDLFQTIFLKIVQAADSYKPNRPLKPWLFTIVANTVRSHFRKRRVQSLVFPEEVKDPSPGSQAVSEARETTSWLKGKIAELPMVQREVLVLACMEGLSLKEVHKILNLPLGTVKTHLRRARLTLTKALVRRKLTSKREVNP